MKSTYRIGIDVGGTFTDVVVLDEETGAFDVTKAINIHADRAETVAAALGRAIKRRHIVPSQISWISHGTTITTNTVIERNGARTALITNKGFRDILEIGRFNRPPELIYRIHADKAEPLVPRYLRLEVNCRTDADGECLTDIDLADLAAAVETIRSNGVEAVAICFLFSFLNPSHEEEVKRRLEASVTGLHIIASSEVLREFREYPRMSTTVFAAYVAPVLRQYVERLTGHLASMEITAPLYIFQSNGGIARPEILMRNPALTLLSGPAGAVVGASKLCAGIGYPRIITMDIGGTSLDVCVVDSNGVETTKTREIDSQPIALPMMNVYTVGAGGGSVVKVDEVGRVTVGPESMGASPGPACYGHGGDEVTLTDINLLLGFINPRTFANGEVPLYPVLAEKAITSQLSGRLGVSEIEAAKGVYRVATSQMADAIQKAALDGGHDARRFVLVAFGGGGPIHACAVARYLGIETVLIPLHPGLFSARGIGLASFHHDYARSLVRPLSSFGDDETEFIFRNLEAEARTDLDLEGIPEARRQIMRSLDLRYLGQSSEINVPVSEARDHIARATLDFHRLHDALYSYKVEDEPIELVNIRVRAIGHVRDLPLESGTPSATAPVCHERRAVHEPNRKHPVEFGIYHRSDLRPGQNFAGPAIVEEPSSSTVVPENCTVLVDRFGNLIIGVGYNG
jgi:N-methylhydantoinase A